jgi:histone deacetylase complex regulatory component SIN3
MIFKIKDPKLFEEYLRKISTHEAFIFFTLDKFITSLTKLINNISVDSLTYKILKDGTKDYENDLNKWADFVFPTVTEQLTRVYREEEQLFRFTYSSTYMMYISAW